MNRSVAGIALLLVTTACPLWSQEAVPLAPLPAGYTLVFREDFTSPDALKRFVFSSADHWQQTTVNDRGLLEHSHAGPSGYSPPHRSPHNIALVATHRFKSFILDCEIQQTGREYGHRDACIFLNFVDPAHYYYAHIATKADPHAHQIFTVDGAPRKAITQHGTTGFDWGDVDAWHPVRVVRDWESGKIDVYVDDLSQPILQAIDKTHGAGYVGFGSFDDTGRVTKIRVYAPEAEASRAGFFSAKE